MKKNQLHNYNATKQILLGKKSISPEFKPFAEWFEKTYAVEIANIIFELAIHQNYPVKTPIPSLEVTFKYIKDFSKFHDENGFTSDFEKKQFIFKKFKAIVAKQGLSIEDVFNEPNSTPESVKNREEYVSVDFVCFEYNEEINAKRNVPNVKINELLDKINNKDIWKLTNDYSGVTVILYTEKQVEKYRNTEAHEKLKALFFELIQAHNQLVFFKQESLFISLNSKERLDKANDSELSNYK